MSLSCGPKIGSKMRGDSHLCVKFYPSTNSDKLSVFSCSGSWSMAAARCFLRSWASASWRHLQLSEQGKPNALTLNPLLTDTLSLPYKADGIGRTCHPLRRGT